MTRHAGPIRVFLADDHQTVRDALALLINAEADMSVIGAAADGREAVQKSAALQPDVVVLDVSMPRLNGAEAAAEIHQLHPEMGLVALTRHAEDAYIQSLLRAGVSGYVLKQSAPSELVQAIRVVAAGGHYLDPALEAQRQGTASRHRRAAADQPLLSAREEQVLRRIAWGFSNKDIAAELEISVKTVEIHKANAMHRLALSSRIDIVRFALLQGWLREA